MKLTLTPSKETIVARLKEHVDAIREDQIASTVTYGGNTYASTNQDINRLCHLLVGLSNGMSLPANFTLGTTDNQDIPFTAASLKLLYAAMITKQYKAMKRAWTLKRAIDVATNPESIDIRSDWPTVVKAIRNVRNKG